MPKKLFDRYHDILKQLARFYKLDLDLVLKLEWGSVPTESRLRYPFLPKTQGIMDVFKGETHELIATLEETWDSELYVMITVKDLATNKEIKHYKVSHRGSFHRGV